MKPSVHAQSRVCLNSGIGCLTAHRWFCGFALNITASSAVAVIKSTASEMVQISFFPTHCRRAALFVGRRVSVKASMSPGRRPPPSLLAAATAGVAQ